MSAHSKKIYNLLIIGDLLLIAGSLPRIFDLNNSGLSLLLKKPSSAFPYKMTKSNNDLTYCESLGLMSPKTYVKQLFDVKEITHERLH